MGMRDEMKLQGLEGETQLIKRSNKQKIKKNQSP